MLLQRMPVIRVVLVVLWLFWSVSFRWLAAGAVFVSQKVLEDIDRPDSSFAVITSTVSLQQATNIYEHPQ